MASILSGYEPFLAPPILLFHLELVGGVRLGKVSDSPFCTGQTISDSGLSFFSVIPWRYAHDASTPNCAAISREQLIDLAA